jgi:hypothetical protein
LISVAIRVVRTAGDARNLTSFGQSFEGEFQLEQLDQMNVCFLGDGMAFVESAAT